MNITLYFLDKSIVTELEEKFKLYSNFCKIDTAKGTITFFGSSLIHSRQGNLYSPGAYKSDQQTGSFAVSFPTEELRDDFVKLAKLITYYPSENNEEDAHILKNQLGQEKTVYFLPKVLPYYKIPAQDQIGSVGEITFTFDNADKVRTIQAWVAQNQPQLGFILVNLKRKTVLISASKGQHTFGVYKTAKNNEYGINFPGGILRHQFQAFFPIGALKTENSLHALYCTPAIQNGQPVMEITATTDGQQQNVAQPSISLFPGTSSSSAGAVEKITPSPKFKNDQYIKAELKVTPNSLIIDFKSDKEQSQLNEEQLTFIKQQFIYQLKRLLAGQQYSLTLDKNSKIILVMDFSQNILYQETLTKNLFFGESRQTTVSFFKFNDSLTSQMVNVLKFIEKALFNNEHGDSHPLISQNGKGIKAGDHENTITPARVAQWPVLANPIQVSADATPVVSKNEFKLIIRYSDAGIFAQIKTFVEKNPEIKEFISINEEDKVIIINAAPKHGAPGAYIARGGECSINFPSEKLRTEFQTISLLLPPLKNDDKNADIVRQTDQQKTAVYFDPDKYKSDANKAEILISYKTVSSILLAILEENCQDSTTLEIVVEPFTISTGHTYGKDMVTQLDSGKPTKKCPNTGLEYTWKIGNTLLQNLITIVTGTSAEVEKLTQIKELITASGQYIANPKTKDNVQDHMLRNFIRAFQQKEAEMQAAIERMKSARLEASSYVKSYALQNPAVPSASAGQSSTASSTPKPVLNKSYLNSTWIKEQQKQLEDNDAGIRTLYTNFWDNIIQQQSWSYTVLFDFINLLPTFDSLFPTYDMKNKNTFALMKKMEFFFDAEQNLATLKEMRENISVLYNGINGSNGGIYTLYTGIVSKMDSRITTLTPNQLPFNSSSISLDMAINSPLGATTTSTNAASTSRTPASQQQQKDLLTLLKPSRELEKFVIDNKQDVAAFMRIEGEGNTKKIVVTASQYNVEQKQTVAYGAYITGDSIAMVFPTEALAKAFIKIAVANEGVIFHCQKSGQEKAVYIERADKNATAVTVLSKDATATIDLSKSREADKKRKEEAAPKLQEKERKRQEEEARKKREEEARKQQEEELRPPRQLGRYQGVSAAVSPMFNLYIHNIHNIHDIHGEHKPINIHDMLSIIQKAVDLYLHRCNNAKFGFSKFAHSGGIERAQTISAHCTQLNKIHFSHFCTTLASHIDTSITNGDCNQRSGLNDALIYVFQHYQKNGSVNNMPCDNHDFIHDKSKSVAQQFLRDKILNFLRDAAANTFAHEAETTQSTRDTRDTRDTKDRFTRR